MLSIPLRQRPHRPLTLRRQSQQMLRPRNLLVSPRKYSPRLSPCLLVYPRCRPHDNMCIRAADAKGADPRNRLMGGPWAQGRRHFQRKFVPLNVGIRRAEMQMGRNLAMLQGQHRLDKTDNARRSFQVTNIGLDRADEQRGCAFSTKDGTERANFNRITERGAGAMRFDIGNFGGRDLGIGQGLAQQLLLGTLVRYRQPTAWPIVIDRAALDDRQYGIAIAFGRAQPLEHDHAAPFAAPITIGTGIKGLTAAIRGEGLHL